MQTVAWRCKEGAILRYPECLEVPLVTKKHGTSQGCTSSEVSKKRKRRKNKPRSSNSGERQQLEHFLQIREYVVSSYHLLLEAAQKIDFFPVQCNKGIDTDGSGGRPCQTDLASLCELDTLVPVSSPPPVLELSQDCVDGDTDVFGSVVSNVNHETAVSLLCWSELFTLPPLSTFLLSDMTKFSLLVDHTVSRVSDFNLIVMDPPWENRSAIRGHKYSWVAEEDLLSLPVGRMLAPAGLVAVWVTNKRKLVDMVTETLFPSWGVQPLAEWLWLKVTADGELVHDLDSVHKKPYETVIIGGKPCGKVLIGKQRPPCNKEEDGVPSKCSSSSCCVERTSEFSHSQSCSHPVSVTSSEEHSTNSVCIDRLKCSSGSELESAPSFKKRKVAEEGDTDDVCQSRGYCSTTTNCVCFRDIPHRYVFMCVPSVVHSQKPYLGDLLSPFLDDNDLKGLELFARNILPGWTSWGNEVLKFQAKN